MSIQLKAFEQLSKGCRPLTEEELLSVAGGNQHYNTTNGGITVYGTRQSGQTNLGAYYSQQYAAQSFTQLAQAAANTNSNSGADQNSDQDSDQDPDQDNSSDVEDVVISTGERVVSTAFVIEGDNGESLYFFDGRAFGTNESEYLGAIFDRILEILEEETPLEMDSPTLDVPIPLLGLSIDLIELLPPFIVRAIIEGLCGCTVP